MEARNELDLSRQRLIVPVEKINEWTIKVFGVGSVGSHFVRTAAKTGFKNIEVYDMDTVDKENIAAQAFDFKHIGMNKVDAMAEIVKEGTGLEIITHHGAIKEEDILMPEAMTVYCCFFDSLPARQMLYNKLKEFPIIWVDARVGNTHKRHYLVDGSIKEDVDNYITTFSDGKGSELACGEKACAPINAMLSAEIVMNIINFINGKTYTKIHIGSGDQPKTNINVLHIREEKNAVQIDAGSTTPNEITLSDADIENIIREARDILREGETMG